MPVETCAERTSTSPTAQDAVWVQNGPGNQLYYPYVSSCVTATLVFQNGLLGGHASQVTPDEKKPQLQPAQNLQDVISRMITAAPDAKTRGAFLKICFIGTTSSKDWDFGQATKAITKEFGQPKEDEPVEYNLSPVDAVFDTEHSVLSIVPREKKAEGADKTIRDAKKMFATIDY